MAFMKSLIDLKGILFFMLLTVTSQATNFDCHGKAFHCVNSTHFMICVDLGRGTSTTIDDVVIPCPSPTVCEETNRFECEFPTPSSTVAATELPTTEAKKFEVTTFAPLPITSIPFEEYLNTVSTTTISQSVFSTDTSLPVKPIDKKWDVSNLTTTENITTEKSISSDINTASQTVPVNITVTPTSDINSSNTLNNSLNPTTIPTELGTESSNFDFVNKNMGNSASNDSNRTISEQKSSTGNILTTNSDLTFNNSTEPTSYATEILVTVVSTNIPPAVSTVNTQQDLIESFQAVTPVDNSTLKDSTVILQTSGNVDIILETQSVGSTSKNTTSYNANIVPVTVLSTDIPPDMSTVTTQQVSSNRFQDVTLASATNNSILQSTTTILELSQGFNVMQGTQSVGSTSKNTTSGTANIVPVTVLSTGIPSDVSTVTTQQDFTKSFQDITLPSVTVNSTQQTTTVSLQTSQNIDLIHETPTVGETSKNVISDNINVVPVTVLSTDTTPDLSTVTIQQDFTKSFQEVTPASATDSSMLLDTTTIVQPSQDIKVIQETQLVAGKSKNTTIDNASIVPVTVLSTDGLTDVSTVTTQQELITKSFKDVTPAIATGNLTQQNTTVTLQTSQNVDLIQETQSVGQTSKNATSDNVNVIPVTVLSTGTPLDVSNVTIQQDFTKSFQDVTPASATNNSILQDTTKILQPSEEVKAIQETQSVGGTSKNTTSNNVNIAQVTVLSTDFPSDVSAVTTQQGFTENLQNVTPVSATYGSMLLDTTTIIQLSQDIKMIQETQLVGDTSKNTTSDNINIAPVSVSTTNIPPVVSTMTNQQGFMENLQDVTPTDSSTRQDTTAIVQPSQDVKVIQETQLVGTYQNTTSDNVNIAPVTVSATNIAPVVSTVTNQQVFTENLQDVAPTSATDYSTRQDTTAIVQPSQDVKVIQVTQTVGGTSKNTTSDNASIVPVIVSSTDTPPDVSTVTTEEGFTKSFQEVTPASVSDSSILLDTTTIVQPSQEVKIIQEKQSVGGTSKNTTIDNVNIVPVTVLTTNIPPVVSIVTTQQRFTENLQNITPVSDTDSYVLLDTTTKVQDVKIIQKAKLIESTSENTTSDNVNIAPVIVLSTDTPPDVSTVTTQQDFTKSFQDVTPTSATDNSMLQYTAIVPPSQDVNIIQETQSVGEISKNATSDNGNVVPVTVLSTDTPPDVSTVTIQQDFTTSFQEVTPTTASDNSILRNTTAISQPSQEVKTIQETQPVGGTSKNTTNDNIKMVPVIVLSTNIPSVVSTVTNQQSFTENLQNVTLVSATEPTNISMLLETTTIVQPSQDVKVLQETQLVRGTSKNTTRDSANIVPVTVLSIDTPPDGSTVISQQEFTKSFQGVTPASATDKSTPQDTTVVLQTSPNGDVIQETQLVGGISKNTTRDSVNIVPVTVIPTDILSVVSTVTNLQDFTKSFPDVTPPSATDSSTLQHTTTIVQPSQDVNIIQETQLVESTSKNTTSDNINIAPATVLFTDIPLTVTTVTIQEGFTKSFQDVTPGSATDKSTSQDITVVLQTLPNGAITEETQSVGGTSKNATGDNVNTTPVTVLTTDIPPAVITVTTQQDFAENMQNFSTSVTDSFTQQDTTVIAQSDQDLKIVQRTVPAGGKSINTTSDNGNRAPVIVLPTDTLDTLSTLTTQQDSTLSGSAAQETTTRIASVFINQGNASAVELPKINTNPSTPQNKTPTISIKSTLTENAEPVLISKSTSLSTEASINAMSYIASSETVPNKQSPTTSEDLSNSNVGFSRTDEITGTTSNVVATMTEPTTYRTDLPIGNNSEYVIKEVLVNTSQSVKNTANNVTEKISQVSVAQETTRNIVLPSIDQLKIRVPIVNIKQSPPEETTLVNTKITPTGNTELVSTTQTIFINTEVSLSDVLHSHTSTVNEKTLSNEPASKYSALLNSNSGFSETNNKTNTTRNVNEFNTLEKSSPIRNFSEYTTVTPNTQKFNQTVSPAHNITYSNTADLIKRNLPNNSSMNLDFVQNHIQGIAISTVTTESFDISHDIESNAETAIDTLIVTSTDSLGVYANDVSNTKTQGSMKERNLDEAKSPMVTQAITEETTRSTVTGKPIIIYYTDIQNSTAKKDSARDTIISGQQINEPLANSTSTDLKQTNTKIEKTNDVATTKSLPLVNDLRISSIYDITTEPLQALNTDIKLSNEGIKTTILDTNDGHNTLSSNNPNIGSHYVTKSIEKEIPSVASTTQTVNHYYRNTNYTSSVDKATLAISLPEITTINTDKSTLALNDISFLLDARTLPEQSGTTVSSTLSISSTQFANIVNPNAITEPSDQTKQAGNSINSQQVSQSLSTAPVQAEITTVHESLGTIRVPVKKIVSTGNNYNIDSLTRPVRRDLITADYTQSNIKTNTDYSTTAILNTVQSTTTSNQEINTNIKYTTNNADTVTRPQNQNYIQNESTSSLSSSYFEVATEVNTTDVMVNKKIESEKTHSGIISFLTPPLKYHESKEKKEKPETKETEAEEQQQEKPINVELASLQDTGLLTATTEIPDARQKQTLTSTTGEISTTKEILIKQDISNFKSTAAIGSQKEHRFPAKNRTNENIHNDTNTSAIGYQKETPTHELIENSALSKSDSNFSNNKSRDQNTSIPQAYNNTVISNDQSSTPRYIMTQAKSTAAPSAQTTGLPTLQYTMTTAKTPVSKLFCRQKKRGRYADELDCRKFYICLGNKSTHIIEGTCPVNTVFSEINKQCTKNLSHCIRNNQFRCATEGRFGDFLNDNVYYICVRNNLSHFIRFKLQCQNGYHLNKTSVRCVLNNDSTSLSESRSASEQSSALTKQEASEATEAPESPEKSEKKFKCKKEGIFPDPSNCKKYFECTKDDSSYRQKKKKCDSGEIFHKDKKKCVDADSYEC